MVAANQGMASVILAALIGCSWAFFRVLAERIFGSCFVRWHHLQSLSVEQTSFTLTCVDQPGQTGLRANVCLEAGGWAFSHGPERLQQSCGLQIKQIQPPERPSPTGIGWFEGPHLASMPAFQS